MTTLWSVSTDHGVSLNADEFVGVLSAHQDRVASAWRALSADEWEQPSRNTSWSNHDTARHVADCVEGVAAQVLGEKSPFSMAEFDPRATPTTWLALSANDSPNRTIERFSTAALRLRTGVAERLAAGDSSVGATVYGPAHWSVNIVHLFWDSWLHERDVLLPLGLPAESTPGEQRLAAIYGLLMAMVPARMMDQSFAATINFTCAGRTVIASHDAGRFSSAETCDATADLEGDLCSIVDALSGRGAALNDVLPNAPEMLGVFAGFMES